MAICPPFLRHMSATSTKDAHSARKTALCWRILLRVAGPRCQLRNWYGEPPVHGIAAKSSVGTEASDTAWMAVATPAALVRSSIAVSLMASQSGGANLPISESSPQQNSTIRRAYRERAGQTEAEEREPPHPLLGAPGSGSASLLMSNSLKDSESESGSAVLA